MLFKTKSWVYRKPTLDRIDLRWKISQTTYFISLYDTTRWWSLPCKQHVDILRNSLFLDYCPSYYSCWSIKSASYSANESSKWQREIVRIWKTSKMKCLEFFNRQAYFLSQKISQNSLKYTCDVTEIKQKSFICVTERLQEDLRRTYNLV